MSYERNGLPGIATAVLQTVLVSEPVPGGPLHAAPAGGRQQPYMVLLRCWLAMPTGPGVGPTTMRREGLGSVCPAAKMVFDTPVVYCWPSHRFAVTRGL